MTPHSSYSRSACQNCFRLSLFHRAHRPKWHNRLRNLCRSDSSPAQSVGQVGGSDSEYIACRICHGVDIDIRLVESVEQTGCIGSVGIKLVDPVRWGWPIAAHFTMTGMEILFLDTAYDIDMTLFERTVLISFSVWQGKGC